MDFELAPLPFALDALAPAMSQETLEYHYGKHHQGYMAKLKAAIQGTPEADKSLEDIIRSASGGLFNNAAQVYNHSFFWQSLKPGGGGNPSGDVAAMIERDFGSADAFRAQWQKAGAGQFGSGWVWLVLEDGKAKIVTTANAGNPLTTSARPLLTCDVWEHAYYIDYRNGRAGFLEAFTDKLLNWDFVAQNLKNAG
ncbi:MAG: superoxide dismutase [Deltaproteobacteria bacterium]|nr:superoxide dismutase [Deltaproteobacteria bacterium]